MKAMIVAILQWVMSAATCLSLWMAGSKDRRAWLALLGVQVLWFVWVPLSGNWGLMPGVVAYTAVAFRNHVRWKRESRDA